MLTVENLTKRFGKQTLFKDATFSVDESVRLGLIGPNGAGKTTFFKMLVGDESPDSGEIRTPKKYKIALMRQEWLPKEEDTVLEATLREHTEWFSLRGQLRELESKMGDNADQKSLAAYHDAESHFAALGGFQVSQTTKELLTGLGFKPDQFGTPATQLSGGWRLRCHLAGLLIQQPDLLLLDEPTNHLDIETVVWLEDYIQSYPHAIMLISHDRRLIERTATDILEFAPPKLTYWPGNLKRFESQKTLRIEQLQAEITNKQKEIDRLQDFVRRFRAKATKARQAQNRLKSSQHYEEQLAAMKEAMPVISKRPAKFRLPLKRRLPRLILEVADGTFGYKKDVPLFELEKCVVEAGRKIGIIGVNGVGKTTFLRCCAGEVPLLDGKLQTASNLEIGYFAQHRMEQLPSAIKVFDYLANTTEGNTVTEIRSVAASLGLGENDLDKMIDVLSGGEKARVTLAQILLRRPGLLLLDEPTNHLDLEACEALVRGLKAYEGTILVVSHNRDFLDSLVEYILEIKPGHADLHHGNYAEWFSRTHGEGSTAVHGTAKSAESTTSNGQKETAKPAGKKSKEQKRIEAQERQARADRLRGVKSELKTTEETLERYRAEFKEIQDFLCTPDAPKDPEFAKKLARHGDLETRIPHLEERWLELSEQIEEDN